MLDFDKNKQCVGCTSCYSACSQNAIRIIENENGFYVPEIVTEQCVSCGQCDSVCPVLMEKKQIRDISKLECVYTYYLDGGIRVKSTSGAVFYALASDMIKRGGLVCGCVWDQNYKAKHICTDNIETVNRMRGSKYVQSDLNDCFDEIKQAVKLRKVLFSGTPCQTTALRHYVGITENLVTCALMCGGVPSAKIWRKYKSALENSVKSKIMNIQMRSKDTNWLVPEIKVTFENNTIVQEVLLTENLYGTNFGLGLTVSNACMNCEFKLDTMLADIVIGDHWGINPKMLKKSENKGASAVIFLTETGMKTFDNIRDQMYAESGDIADITGSHSILMNSHCENNNREEFFASLDKEDIINLFSRYLPASIKNGLPRRITLQKLKLFIPLYTLRWRFRYKHNK
jgi:coenzyme F420-reducing hydrogenase beta subunit